MQQSPGNVEFIRNEALEWLRETQDSSGGFGKDPSDEPRLGQTAIAVAALIESDDLRNQSSAIRSIDWLLKNATIPKIKDINTSDAFDIYNQAIVQSGNIYKKRRIAHEYPLEPFILNSLCLSLQKSGSLKLGGSRSYRISSLILKLTKSLIDRQVNKGPFRGAFESRRSSPSEHYPIYWIYYAIRSLDKVRDVILSKDLKISSTILGSLPIRIFLIIIACSIFVVFRGWKPDELVLILVTGVAVNLLSVFVVRE